MKRGRIVDFTSNPDHGVRVYRTGVTMRGPKTAKCQVASCRRLRCRRAAAARNSSSPLPARADCQRCGERAQTGETSCGVHHQPVRPRGGRSPQTRRAGASKREAECGDRGRPPTRATALLIPDAVPLSPRRASSRRPS